MIPISLYYGQSIQILHNDIYRCPYSGISCGWGWAEFNGRATKRRWSAIGKKGGKPSFGTRDIKINNNRITHIRFYYIFKFFEIMVI